MTDSEKLDEILRLLRAMPSGGAAAGTNGNGGAKSGWRMLRAARYVPPGTNGGGDEC